MCYYKHIFCILSDEWNFFFCSSNWQQVTQTFEPRTFLEWKSYNPQNSYASSSCVSHLPSLFSVVHKLLVVSEPALRKTTSTFSTTLSCILWTWSWAILGSRPSTVKESCGAWEQQRKHSWKNKLHTKGNSTWINEKNNQKNSKFAVLTPWSNFPLLLCWQFDPCLVMWDSIPIDMGVSCLHHSDVQWADLFKQWAVVF